MIWPEPLRDETLYSWLARTARLNAVSGDLAFCDELTGTRATSIMAARFNLSVLCKKSAGVLGNPANVLRRMTAFQVAANLGDVEKGCIQGIAAGTQTFDLTASAFGGVCRWRFCPECLKDDIAEIGVAWWHRAHQLPTTLVCTVHGTALHWLDVKRHRVYERFVLPTDGDIGPTLNLATITSGNPDLWKALAALGRDALEGREAPPSVSIIHHALVAGLHQQGLITRMGNLRRDEYLAQFAHHIGSLRAPGLLKRLDTAVEPLSLVHGIWPGRQGRQPLIRLLLVYWLYGSWQSYLARCHWESVLGPDRRSALVAGDASPIAPSNESANRHREICQKFLAEHVPPSRSAFWRAHPASLRWLKRYDATWLNFHFPLGSQKGRQRDLFD